VATVEPLYPNDRQHHCCGNGLFSGFCGSQFLIMNDVSEIADFMLKFWKAMNPLRNDLFCLAPRGKLDAGKRGAGAICARAYTQ